MKKYHSHQSKISENYFTNVAAQKKGSIDKN